METTEMEAKIRSFLEAKAPAQVSKIPVLLESPAFKGNPGKLLRMLEKRYDGPIGKVASLPEDELHGRLVRMVMHYAKNCSTESEAKAQLQKLLSSEKFQGKPEGLMASLVKKYGPEPSTQSQKKEETDQADYTERAIKILLFYKKCSTREEAEQHMKSLLLSERFKNNPEALLNALVRKNGPEPPPQSEDKDRELRSRIVNMIILYKNCPTEEEATRHLTAFLESEQFKDNPEGLLTALVKKYGPEPNNGEARNPPAPDPAEKARIMKMLTFYGSFKSHEDTQKHLATLLESDQFKNNTKKLLEALVEQYGAEPETFEAHQQDTVSEEIMRLVMKHGGNRSKEVAEEQIQKLLKSTKFAGNKDALLAALKEKYEKNEAKPTPGQNWSEKCTMLMQLHDPDRLPGLGQALKEQGGAALYQSLKEKYEKEVEIKKNPVFSEGMRVTLCNLIKAGELNGRRGIITKTETNGICTVSVDGLGDKMLKEANLKQATPEENKIWDQEILVDYTAKILKLIRTEQHTRTFAIASLVEDMETDSRTLHLEEESMSFNEILTWATHDSTRIPRFGELLSKEAEERTKICSHEAASAVEGILTPCLIHSEMLTRRETEQNELTWFERTRSEGKIDKRMLGFSQFECGVRENAVAEEAEDRTEILMNETVGRAVSGAAQIASEEKKERESLLPKNITFRSRLIRYYNSLYPNQDNTKQVTLMLERYTGREDDLVKALEAKYGRSINGPDYTEKLTQIYQKYAPEKLHTIHVVLASYKGREDDLFSALASRYNDDDCLVAAEDDTSSGPDLQRSKKFSEYKKRLDAVKKANPSVEITYQDLVEKYVGFEDQLLSRLEARIANSSSATVGVKPPTRYAERLTRFYQTYAPQKLPTVNSSLRTYRGKEEELFEMLVAAYGPEPVSGDSEGDDSTTSYSSSSTEGTNDDADEEDQHYNNVEEEARKLLGHLLAVSDEYKDCPEVLLDAIRTRLMQRKELETEEESNNHNITNNKVSNVCPGCGHRYQGDPDTCGECGTALREKIAMKSIPGNGNTPHHTKIEQNFISGSYLWYRTHPSVSTGPGSWKKAWFYIQDGTSLMRKRENSNAAKTTVVLGINRILNVTGYDLGAHEAPPVTRCRHLVFSATLSVPVTGTKWYSQLLMCADSMQMKREWISGLKAAVKGIDTPVREGSPDLRPHDNTKTMDEGSPRHAPEPGNPARIFYQNEGAARWGCLFCHVEGPWFCAIRKVDGDTAEGASGHYYFPLSLLQRADWIKTTHLNPPVGTHGTGLRLQFRRKSVFITASLKSSLAALKASVFDGMRSDFNTEAQPPVFSSLCNVKGGLPCCFPLPSPEHYPTRIVPRSWEVSAQKIVKQENLSRKAIQDSEIVMWSSVKKGPPRWLTGLAVEERASRSTLEQDFEPQLASLYREAGAPPRAVLTAPLPLKGLPTGHCTADSIALGTPLAHPIVPKKATFVLPNELCIRQGSAAGSYSGELPSP
eukprot:TRINITY_DN4654_c5_g1_i1.p1 TRINITY_DN4654_c5_g1~~TRINITY_DN4654_c5_g1_i1.p1  ORF type:complete len:1509 (+),score=276.35 TRINITY_DN4654_c5_g1_i1:74-4528(+)